MMKAGGEELNGHTFNDAWWVWGFAFGGLAQLFVGLHCHIF
jgi:hypothetical protein